MRKFFILLLLIPSLAWADFGMGPGPGVKSYAAGGCSNTLLYDYSGTTTSEQANLGQYHPYFGSLFTTTETSAICRVDIIGQRTGSNPSLTYQVCVYADGGSQAGTCSTNTVNWSDWPTSEGIVSFTGISTGALTNSANYRIVLKASGTNGTNYVLWSAQTGYVAGGLKWSDNLSSWTNWDDVRAKFKAYK